MALLQRALPLLGVVAAGMVGGACLPSPDNQRDAGTLEPLPDSETVIVSGYVWDPEAVQFAFGMCGPACSQRPTLAPGQTYYDRSLVSFAQVQLIDHLGVAAYSTRSNDGGAWTVPDVAREPEPWLYTLAWKPVHVVPADSGTPDAGGDADAGFDAGAPDAGDPDAGVDGGSPADAGRTDGGTADAGPTAPNPYLGPVPAANTYFPTVTISNPISPNLFQCVGRPAAVLGNTGMLDAVARFLSSDGGTPTTAADLVDPTRFGGVVVWWLYAPGGSTSRVGVSGATVTASEGQTVYVNWGCPSTSLCPPGPSVPGAGLATKSARNFFVMPGATSSNVGLSVTLLPPGTTGPVTFVAADSTPAPDGGTDGGAAFRPYRFAKLPAVAPLPGKIVFGQALALPDVVAAPPGYECAPEAP